MRTGPVCLAVILALAVTAKSEEIVFPGDRNAILDRAARLWRSG